MEESQHSQASHSNQEDDENFLDGNEHDDDGVSHEEGDNGSEADFDGMEEREHAGEDLEDAGSEKDDEEFTNKYSDDHSGEEGESGEDQYEHEEDEEEELNEEHEIEEEDSGMIAPERKVRHKAFRFINKMRDTYHWVPYERDRLGDISAMEYARYLLGQNQKENEAEAMKIAKANYFPGSFNISSFSIIIDDSNDEGEVKRRFVDFMDEFMDAHATLVEFDHHRENLLSSTFNSVSIGLAFNENKAVVVDLFSVKECIVDSIALNPEQAIVSVNGRMLITKNGVFALRILKVDENSNLKEITSINPHNIIYNKTTQTFTAIFKNVPKVFNEPGKKVLDVYLREKPDTIKYETAYTAKIDFKDLPLGTRCMLEVFPHPREIREHALEDKKEMQKVEDEENRLQELKRQENDEKNRRMMKNEGYDPYKGKLEQIIEEEGDEVSDDEHDRRPNKKTKKPKMKENESMVKSNVSDDSNSQLMEENSNLNKNYEQQFEELEKNITSLKLENEDLQRRIAIMYEFKKTSTNEEKVYNKDTNINDSTYTDSLTSAANLYNELNTHRKRLNADLSKYEQSINIQKERKKEVYDILMKYKQELIANARTKQDKPIPEDTVKTWFDKERQDEEDIKALRIENIKSTLELGRLNKQLKKMEEYFEGLHVIDFEQLKIENNTLTEKIEDRNEEIHKLKNKINSNVQILSHLQEKYAFVTKNMEKKNNESSAIDTKLKQSKMDLSKQKSAFENNAMRSLHARQKIAAVNSDDLTNYYGKTNENIYVLSDMINEAIGKLTKLRVAKKGGNKGEVYLKDINDLKQRTKECLIKFENKDEVPKFEK